ncbi:MAG: hypothetical protein A2W31_15375 [Planctomycetes bacterium RBG_16_64_10]|nr:MAG: hypothetical protein A2W31_15375 [Planctomycetes bacterium RBG_16_64_10]
MHALAKVSRKSRQRETPLSVAEVVRLRTEAEENEVSRLRLRIDLSLPVAFAALPEPDFTPGILHVNMFFIHVHTRRVYLAGMTPNPDSAWMAQSLSRVTASQCHQLPL